MRDVARVADALALPDDGRSMARPGSHHAGVDIRKLES